MNAIAPSVGMKRSEQINELAKGLAKAQGLFASAERDHVAKVQMREDKGGGSYTFNYADLAAYLEVCREPLAQSGLSFVQATSCEAGDVSVATMLMHESGQWIEFPPLTLHAADTKPQTIGSAITYARRYSLSAALGMASEADDDGNAANGNQAETQRREPRKQLPPCPSCGKPDGVISGKAEYGAGLLCFKAKGGCGHSWETAEHPFNEKHKAKSNGKRKEEEPQEDPFTSNEGAFFDYLRDEIGQISGGRAFNAFRAKAAQAFGEKKITAKQLGSLIGSLVHKASSVSGLNELGKWIADVRIEMNADDSKCFDEAEELIREKLEGLAAGAT